jgi:hypothetical protein
MYTVTDDARSAKFITAHEHANRHDLLTVAVTRMVVFPTTVIVTREN